MPRKPASRRWNSGAARAPGLDAAAIRKLLDENGLSVSQYAPEAPNFSDPARHPDLLKMIDSAIADARILGCDKITLVGHRNVDGMTREAMLAGYTTGLMRIAPVLEAASITALVEPFNTVNHLNHLLNGSRPAYAMIKAVNSPRIKLLWDFYHMQLEEGDLIEKFKAGIDQVGYVQIGDVPGRHEPGTGEVNHAGLIRAVRAAGYQDKIGLEFMPLNDNWRRGGQVGDRSRRSGLTTGNERMTASTFPHDLIEFPRVVRGAGHEYRCACTGRSGGDHPLPGHQDRAAGPRIYGRAVRPLHPHALARHRPS